MNAGRPQRKNSLRLRNFDYTSGGAYFVTMCTYDRSPLFADVALTEIVRHEWQTLPERFPSVRLDEFVVMPNHLHFVIWLVGAPLAGARGVQRRRTERLRKANLRRTDRPSRRQR